MPQAFVRRRGGPGKYELSWLTTLVNLPAYVVPQIRYKLPLIEKAGGSTGQKGLRGDLGQSTCIGIRVKEHLTMGVLAASLCFSAASCAFNQHRAGYLQRSSELLINYAGKIVRHALFYLTQRIAE